MWRLWSGVSERSLTTKDAEQRLSLSEEEKIIHAKRVSQILRYISTLQTAGNGGGGGQFLFVRNAKEHLRPFYSNTHSIISSSNEEETTAGRVLFTTFDFQQLLAAAGATGNNATLASSTPFSFYTTSAAAGRASQQPSSRKRSAWGTVKNGSEGIQAAATAKNNTSSSCCWLRLTRMASGVNNNMTAQPSLDPPEVQAYLQEWSKSSKQSIDQLLTLKHIASAPPCTNPQVTKFLRRYRQHLHQKYLHRRLERIYNSLFEWYDGGGANNSHELDLIWGMGQAIWRDHVHDTVVDGPLLEVKVEVELARDGALLIRPRQHTGVVWNRSVLAALESSTTRENASAASASSSRSKKWNQWVDALDPFQDINPSEPKTYVPLLKQLAVECAAGGTFVPSGSCNPSSLSSIAGGGKLVVTDAWCLYASPRPSAVWARDALAFCEQPQNNNPTMSNHTTNTSGTLATTRPSALWALTHGPSALERVGGGSNNSQSLDAHERRHPPATAGIRSAVRPDQASVEEHIHFPLPTSEAQNRIAQLLLTQNYPAVVCEGPPGTGKTHTIANIVCAYLCQGKRVLVTSKGAPALSVLRERLPPCVQQLCVDVSMRESVGMRQLQQTVERLANKVSWVHTEREQRRSETLLQEIVVLKQELIDIDRRLSLNAERKHAMVHTTAGQTLFETSLHLIESVPWLMRTMANWDVKQVSFFYNQFKEVVLDPPHDPIHHVSGYPAVPSPDLISLAASRAGLPSSYVKNLVKGVLASLPWFGSEMSRHCSDIQKELDHIRVYGSLLPLTNDDWKLVVRALEKHRAVQLFCCQVLDPLLEREGWPKSSFYGDHDLLSKRTIKADMLPMLESALKIKELEADLKSSDEVKTSQECIHLDSRRTLVSKRIQDLSEDYVACRVVVELSKNFTAEAQSALVKFAQVSGKSRFGKSSSSQSAKMTQRQRRKRQEYLDAFEKCVRYIPCWILTSSQISDYLPAECLFDLVVIDEASQSDISVLPGMLRGKQWLIVGDGKQVSPTESFVAEEQIEMLKSALPDSPFESSMLPGHSFFDLCAQAYPRGRVILREHFRCAPEIIAYSNSEFYNDNLIPLRLPTSEERLDPSLIDIYLKRGKKTGKVNLEECDEIVRLIKEYVESCSRVKKRTIGVISLVGDEQSRLIRGRLLDSVGPHKYKLHDILVGEPPSFQGAERDIIFLSMVCSPGSVVTQNQLMHAQRVNVALSRARDRMVLVRSIESNHIPNEQDIKFSILDFFERAKLNDEAKAKGDDMAADFRMRTTLSLFRSRAERLLEKLLNDRGYCTQSMGVVWEDAICVEDATNKTARAAICIEATGETHDEWTSLFEQQKSIERVGWKCLRVDGGTFLWNHARALVDVELFLSRVGVNPTTINAPASEADESDTESQAELMEIVVAPLAAVGDVDGEPGDVNAAEAQPPEEQESVVVIVSSEDEDERKIKAVASAAAAEDDQGAGVSAGLGNGETASDYGNIAGLGFLQVSGMASSANVAKAGGVLAYFDDDEDDDDDQETGPRATKRRSAVDDDFDRLKSLEGSDDDNHNESKASTVAVALLETHATCVADTTSVAFRTSLRRKRLRQDKYSRDGRWYPSHAGRESDVSYEEYIAEVLPEQDVEKEAATVKKRQIHIDEDDDDAEQNNGGDSDSYIDI